MIIECRDVGPVQANCYVVAKEKGAEGVVIDPGTIDVSEIVAIIEANQLNITHILLTHGHFDHILGIDELRNKYGAKVCIHKDDQEKLTLANENLSKWMGADYTFQAADVILEDGDMIKVGSDDSKQAMEFKVIHTPGHTTGGVCYLLDEHLFSGDSLFAGSIGRTDFPGGSMRTLVASLKEKILTLPDSVKVYPGHNQFSTIAEEKQDNPYLR